MVTEYLDSAPDPSAFDFLRHDFDVLAAAHAGVVATSFSQFPSYPQRFAERMSEQPICEGPMAGVDVEPWRERPPRRVLYTEADLHVRHFTLDTSRKQSARAGRAIAAA